jgi:hypothetical protein
VLALPDQGFIGVKKGRMMPALFLRCPSCSYEIGVPRLHDLASGRCALMLRGQLRHKVFVQGRLVDSAEQSIRFLRRH